jgi:hypothetical protein
MLFLVTLENVMPVACVGIVVHAVAPGPDEVPAAQAVVDVAPEPGTKVPASAGLHDVEPDCD